MPEPDTRDEIIEHLKERIALLQKENEELKAKLYFKDLNASADLN